MSHYRGYFMQGDHISAPENIEAASDADAMLVAGGLLSKSQFTGIEVWQEKRVVGSLSVSPTPASAVKDEEETVRRSE